MSALAAVAADAPGPAYQSAGTRKMAERIEKVTRDLNPMENPFLSKARAQRLQAQFQALTNAPRAARTTTAQFNAQLKYPIELLNAGKSEEALRHFQELEAFFIQMNAYDSPRRTLLRRLIALSYLRLGSRRTVSDITTAIPVSCRFGREACMWNNAAPAARWKR
jgi:hypothetical protein